MKTFLFVINYKILDNSISPVFTYIWMYFCNYWSAAFSSGSTLISCPLRIITLIRNKYKLFKIYSLTHSVVLDHLKVFLLFVRAFQLRPLYYLLITFSKVNNFLYFMLNNWDTYILILHMYYDCYCTLLFIYDFHSFLMLYMDICIMNNFLNYLISFK
jgi:hypothetical protein